MKAWLFFGLILVAIALAGLMINVSADENLIPSWIKTTMEFWVNDQISDEEVLSALQFLIDQGLLTIPQDSEQVDEIPVQTQQTLKIEDYLPTRDDIGTEWKIMEIENTTLNCEGFVEGVIRPYVLPGLTELRIIMVVVKLNSADDASNCYDTTVDSVYQEGGFKEWDPSISGAGECYGTTHSIPGSDWSTIFCVKDNFFITGLTAGSYWDLEQNSESFVQSVIDKI